MEKKDDISERVDIDYRFSKLNNNDQQQLAKTLIWKKLVHEYIEKQTDLFAKGYLGIDAPTKEQIEEYRSNLVIESGAALHSLIDTMFGEDEELKYGIFKKFVDSYRELKKKTKKEICGNNHNFTEWKEITCEEPQYDEEGQLVEYMSGKTYFERTCAYCGEVQRAYSESQKENIEELTDFLADCYKNIGKIDNDKRLIRI